MPVIVGYVRPLQLKWVLSKRLYNLRGGDRPGSTQLSEKFINAKYVLLHNNKKCFGLIKLKGPGPTIYNYAGLVKKGYPQDQEVDPSRIYLVYSLDDNIEEEYKHYSWDVQKDWSTAPQVQTLSDLINIAHHNSD